MDVERDLTQAYEEWRRLAEAEGEAIRARDWNGVAACQQALKNLQPRISRLSPAVRKAWSAPGVNRAVKEQELNTLLHHLIQLERRNQTLIATMKEAARQQLDQFGQVRRNLHQLRRSYGLPPRATWHSYS
jgi:hypothetical protein